jgi:acetyl-CoA acetyltransferase family protein
MMREVFVVDGVRSPMCKGRAGGALANTHPADVLAQVLAGLVARTSLDPSLIEDVIVGCVSQVGEQGGNIARIAALAAGLPVSVPGTTLDRKCGSGQQAVHFAAQAIGSGAAEIVIAAGVESMSRVPMGSSVRGVDPFGELFRRRYPEGMVGQGVASELVSERWNIGREELDAYSVQSHQRAARSQAGGGFDRELVPIRNSEGQTIETDETIRPNTTLDALAGLNPAFVNPVAQERFGAIEWKTTAGNSSQIADGAAAVLLASAQAVDRHRLRPRARIVAMDVVGDDPVLMLTAPIAATARVLRRANMAIEQIEHFEVNEAFASVPLAWQREYPVSNDLLNPRGGAIALGHPLGASGVRLLVTMLHALIQEGGRRGLQTMCEAGGMANATIIEVVN